MMTWALEVTVSLEMMTNGKASEIAAIKQKNFLHGKWHQACDWMMPDRL